LAKLQVRKFDSLTRCVRLGSVLVKGCRGLKTQHLYQSHACTGDARVADFDPATCCVFVGNFSEGQGTIWNTPHIALNFCTSKFKYKYKVDGLNGTFKCLMCAFSNSGNFVHLKSVQNRPAWGWGAYNAHPDPSSAAEGHTLHIPPPRRLRRSLRAYRSTHVHFSN